ITRVALLDQETKAIPGPGVGGEIEVPLEDVDQRHHELRGLAHVVDRLEERALHLAVYRRDAHVGLGLATRDRPAPVLAPSREAHPGARRVAPLDRLAAEVPGGGERAEARREERRRDGGTIRHWPIIAGARAPRTQES